MKETCVEVQGGHLEYFFESSIYIYITQELRYVGHMLI